VLMPAEAAFKRGVADFAAGHEPDDRYARDSLLDAAYRCGYDAARRQAEGHHPDTPESSRRDHGRLDRMSAVSALVRP